MTSLTFDRHEFKYHDPLISKAKLFSRAMDSEIFRFCVSGFLLSLLVVLSWLHMRELRKKLLQCEGKCKELPECINKHLEVAKKVRGVFMSLENSARGSWTYGIHRKALGVVVDEWDDLVIDLSISADPEVHRLVSKFRGLL